MRESAAANQREGERSEHRCAEARDKRHGGVDLNRTGVRNRARLKQWKKAFLMGRLALSDDASVASTGAASTGAPGSRLCLGHTHKYTRGYMASCTPAVKGCR